MVEEVPNIDLLTLISNVGGTLGLFLGMSFLSFLEILELLAEIYFMMMENIEKKVEKSKTSLFKFQDRIFLCC